MNKEKLVKRVQDFVRSNKELDMEAWAWLDISKEELDTQNDYLILLDWQEGYDEDENKLYEHDGFGLNISIRVNHNQYFATDNPMPTVNDKGDVADGCTLSEADVDDDFLSISKWIIDELEFAIEFDEMNMEDLDWEEQEQLFKLKETLDLHIGDTIEVHDYDDEDLMDLIEERGSNEFVVNSFSYYDGMVWAEDCEYGIDMQYISKVVDKQLA